MIQFNNSEIFFIIILILLVMVVTALISMYYGIKAGVKQTLSTPNMKHPSLPEVTILGRYLIQSQTSEEVFAKLSYWLRLKGYYAVSFPNIVEVHRIGAPPIAAKKKNYFSRLELTRDGLPDSMTLNLHSVKNDSKFLELEATCLPVMANKLGQYVQFLFPESSVKDAQRNCKDFMANTMSILGAETLVAPHIEDTSACEATVKFLANIPSQSDINEKAHELIAKAKERILITGWIDREFLGDIENAKSRGVEISVVTKSPESSDKTIKQDFKRLSTLLGKKIKINSRVHDRFLLCDKTCIIGSIYYVSVSKTRFESAVHTDAEQIVTELEKHFEEIWNDPDSKKIG